MDIHSFSELTEEQKRNIYQFLRSFPYRGSFESYEEMIKLYGGFVFDNGCSHFSLWEGNSLIGALGVVSKDTSIRNEIFLIGISFKEADNSKLPLLLSRAFDYCSGIKADRYKLGLNHDRYYLIPAVQKSGFREVYRYLEMKFCGSTPYLPAEADSRFMHLSPGNIKDFQKVHNAAFLQAPNGAAIEDSELPEYLEEYGDSALAGIYYADGIAAGVYILKLNGSAGYIDGIGVSPEFSGQGIGKKLLFKSIRVLQDKGASKVELSVFDSNKRALELYLKNCFEIHGEHSVWYEK